jgi:hypothetical protein
VDPARVEECLLLVDAGSPVAELDVEGACERVQDALLAGRFEAVGAIWREEWAAVARAGLAGSDAARVAEVLLTAGAGACSPPGPPRAVAAPARGRPSSRRRRRRGCGCSRRGSTCGGSRWRTGKLRYNEGFGEVAKE